jgi:hypothetical protein
MQSSALGASYDSATASNSRRQQQQPKGALPPQVRRAAVVPVQSRNATGRIPSLGLSFDESQTQPNPPPAPPQSRKILSQSVSNPHERAGSGRAQWSLGASVYCRFAVQKIHYCLVFASLTTRVG